MIKLENPPITTLSSRIAWECPWYRVRQDRIRLPDGSEGVYNVIEKCDAVWIVPITPAGKVVLVRSYRHTLGEWAYELPAGGIKDGQTPLQAAQEELQEETGGSAEHWQFLLRASTINGIGTEYGHIYLAQGVTLGAPHHEPAEVITIHTLPLDEALAMARRGDINDTNSVLGLLLAEPFLLD